ncbi:ABC transporter substrate-binding protein [Ramlibacter rhizophilus]|uniref:ABC transporter substrate-binding protein n=2 Tax=Ramlibacter rhizophilus TaxID=1781167 RepID=A0A4Z0BFT7_9BURK|nr:ABC transporter substrate-binding protein [Ramlibacter rhizophilus]
MATRLLQAELASLYQERRGTPVETLAIGGVDAAKRVEAGEPFDFVVLGSDAIDKLIAAGAVVPGSRVDLVLSKTYVAVRQGAPKPDISSEAAVREAVLAASTVGNSTGPSGVALARLFERWGISEQIKDRVVTARPGVPVGSLVAQGEVELGFQQLSELIHVEGIDILGELPPQIAIDTIFSGGICTASTRPEEARALLAFMASPEAAAAKKRQGMSPAP